MFSITTIYIYNIYIPTIYYIFFNKVSVYFYLKTAYEKASIWKWN